MVEDDDEKSKVKKWKTWTPRILALAEDNSNAVKKVLEFHREDIY